MDVLLILMWLVCAIVTAIAADSKHRSEFGWLVIGLLFGPFALLLIIVLPPSQEGVRQAGLRSGALRECPRCATAISRRASRCPACQADIDPLPDPAPKGATVYRSWRQLKAFVLGGSADD